MSTTSDEHAIELDAETVRAVEDWLTHVLPLYADECAEKIRADAYAEVKARIAAGVAPRVAVGELTPAWRLSIQTGQRYLSKTDVLQLRRVGQQLAMPISCRWNVTWSAAAIILLLILNVGVLSVTPNYVGSVFLPTTLVFCVLFLAYLWSTSISRFVVKRLGPLGLAFIHAETVGLLMAGAFSCILAVPQFFVMMPGATVFSTSSIESLFIMLAILAVPLLWSIRNYFNVRARIRNNYAIVTELLGLPEYWIEE